MGIEGNWQPVSRRRFLTRVGAAAGTLALGSTAEGWTRTWAHPRFTSDPFTLGVASGEPLPSGVVLWTRLAPELLADGGMPRRRVPVRWEVAKDAGFRRVVEKGLTFADPEFAHSVHVEVDDLRPGYEYYYRFKAGTEISPVGRTKTAPGPYSRPNDLAFAVASCQHYEQGYYTAYGHMAKEDLDFVVHLGDYIYEGPPNLSAVRQHDGPEPIHLLAYRRRHTLYGADADLQAAREAFPFIATWDDHEVENNYAGDVPQDEPGRVPDTPGFLRRRAAAYQAYYEHMPLRHAQRPGGPYLRLFRRRTFGNLLELNVMDTRQYRSDQACGDGQDIDCAERLAPARTITGAKQEAWLLNGLGRSRARWNVLAQQVFFAQRDTIAGPQQRFSMDAWDGYTASRNRVLAGIVERRVRNPVVLTGDVHNHWACDLKANFDDPASPTVGVELVGSSITSGGDGSDTIAPATQVTLAENPHIRYFKGRRGYVHCDVARDQWQANFRTVAYVSTRGAPISTDASFVIEDGHPGLQQVSEASREGV